jgi:hypothetical protein
MVVMKIIFAAIVCSILTACASEAVKVSDATDVPANRILANPKINDAPKAKLIVVRDSGSMTRAGARFATLKIDGVDVADIGRSEKYACELNEGSHVLAVHVGGDSPEETESILKAGDTAYFRISADPFNGPRGPHLQRTMEVQP